MEGGNTPGRVIAADERFGRADPKIALMILVKSAHKRFDRTAGNLGQLFKRRLPCGKKSGRHSTRGYPDISFPILQQGVYFILGETLGIGGTIRITYKSPLLPVEFEQTKAVRCKP